MLSLTLIKGNLPSGEFPNNTYVNNMTKPKNSIQQVCPECEAKDLHHDFKRDETVCKGCGLVLEGPPAYCAGLIQIDYPWQFTFDPSAFITSNRSGYKGYVYEPYYYTQWTESAVRPRE